MLSMSIIELLASTSDDSWPKDADIFTFLVVGAPIGALSEVIGERTMTLSRDSELLNASEHCFVEVQMDRTVMCQ